MLTQLHNNNRQYTPVYFINTCALCRRHSAKHDAISGYFYCDDLLSLYSNRHTQSDPHTHTMASHIGQELHHFGCCPHTRSLRCDLLFTCAGVSSSSSSSSSSVMIIRSYRSSVRSLSVRSFFVRPHVHRSTIIIIIIECE